MNALAETAPVRANEAQLPAPTALRPGQVIRLELELAPGVVIPVANARLRFSLANGSVVLVLEDNAAKVPVAEGGVWRSGDGGGTWKVIS